MLAGCVYITRADAGTNISACATVLVFLHGKRFIFIVSHIYSKFVKIYLFHIP